MVLPASSPHDAETISFGRASSIRLASSAGANPPNTTEWTAPTRAQASMAIDGLRHHRHVDHHPVARLDAELKQRTAELRHPFEQLRIAVRPPPARDRGVEDQRVPVGGTADHVTVQRVVAGVEPPAREPAIDRGARLVQHPGGRLEPVDRPSLVGPEAFTVGDAACVLLRVCAHRCILAPDGSKPSGPIGPVRGRVRCRACCRTFCRAECRAGCRAGPDQAQQRDHDAEDAGASRRHPESRLVRRRNVEGQPDHERRDHHGRREHGPGQPPAEPAAPGSAAVSAPSGVRRSHSTNQPASTIVPSSPLPSRSSSVRVSEVPEHMGRRPDHDRHAGRDSTAPGRACWAPPVRSRSQRGAMSVIGTRSSSSHAIHTPDADDQVERDRAVPGVREPPPPPPDSGRSTAGPGPSPRSPRAAGTSQRPGRPRVNGKIGGDVSRSERHGDSSRRTGGAKADGSGAGFDRPAAGTSEATGWSVSTGPPACHHSRAKAINWTRHQWRTVPGRRSCRPR